MIKLIPSWVWVLLAALIGLYFYGQYKEGIGRGEVKAEWDKAVERGKIEVARLKAEAGKITTVTEVRFVEREKKIYEKGKDIVKYIEVLIPDDSCELAPGFRVLHDAAVDNRIPDPSEVIDAAPVSATEVAATVTENYTGCNANAAKIEEWQNWAREQCALNKNGCPDNG